MLESEKKFRVKLMYQDGAVSYNFIKDLTKAEIQKEETKSFIEHKQFSYEILGDAIPLLPKNYSKGAKNKNNVKKKQTKSRRGQSGQL